jgi:hypothetical protein
MMVTGGNTPDMYAVLPEFLPYVLDSFEHLGAPIFGREQLRLGILLVDKVRELNAEKAEREFSRICVPQQFTHRAEHDRVVVCCPYGFGAGDCLEVRIPKLQCHGAGLPVFSPKPRTHTFDQVKENLFQLRPVGNIVRKRLFFADTFSRVMPNDSFAAAPADDPMKPHAVFAQKAGELFRGKALHIRDQPESSPMQCILGFLADAWYNANGERSQEIPFRSVRNNRNAVWFHLIGGNFRNCLT